MKIQRAKVVRHEAYAGEYSILELNVPDIAGATRPGQFVHLRIPDLEVAVLRRPFSIFRADTNSIAILYKCVGRGTDAMRSIPPGSEISLIGPLGNGFPDPDPGCRPVLVAGGYGVAPLCCLAAHTPMKGVAFIGGASAGDILCVDELESMGWEVHAATEDGSLGQTGLVTDVLDGWMANALDAIPELFACGPDGMLRAVGQRALQADCRGWLSLDKHMGCGVGACLACVQRIREPDGAETWKRVCRDGPIFEARQVIWPGEGTP